MATDAIGPALRHAIAWRVRMDSGAATAGDHRALAEWLASDASHRAAWERVDTLLQEPLAHIDAAEAARRGSRTASARALARGSSIGRRHVANGVLALLGAAGTAWTVDRQAPLSTLLADRRTRTGERRGETLADGSALLLNARSAVDLQAGGPIARLVLREGQAALRTRGRDWHLAAPRAVLLVRDAHAFVDHAGGSSRFGLLSGRGELRLDDGRRLPLRGGECGTVAPDGGGAIVADAHARGAWTEGLVDARDATLGEVVDQLRPYFAGAIRLEPQAAALHLSAVLPLDQPAQALQTVAETLPIRLQRFGPWLLRVEHA